MIILTGKEYVVNWHGDADPAPVTVGDAAYNTSTGTTGFFCTKVDDPSAFQVVYPQDFLAESV